MTDTTPQSSSNQPPRHECRIGSVRGAIWENQTKEGKTVLSATFSRSYQAANGDWRDSTSFNARELCLLAGVIQRVLARMETEQAALKAEEPGDASS